MKDLEKIIGYSFKNKKILKTALTHSSYANENKCASYERLEFLGDSVLSIIVSEYLYDEMKKTPEGDLSRIRSALVCEDALAELARKLNISEYIYLGNGEERAGSRNRNSILCDIFEAILAAIYLDGGMENARKFVRTAMRDNFNNALQNKYEKDFKSRLQEALQHKYHDKTQIVYTTIKESGPEHLKRFVVELTINGKKTSTGEGRSKKEAEQEAARKALAILKL